MLTIVLSILNLCRYHCHYGADFKAKVTYVGCFKNYFRLIPLPAMAPEDVAYGHILLLLINAFLLFYDVVCVQQGPCAFCVHYMSELDVRLWH